MRPGGLQLPDEVAAGVKARLARAIARAISWIEDDDPRASTVLAALFPATGNARTIGVTGPPGAGKSTFVDRLAEVASAAGHRVAVIAVDPASPFTGGAILGDRVRLGDVLTREGFYFRSMSSRGHLGGLARATEAAVQVLDAAGYDTIIVETVGVGQSEIEVAQLADTTLLVQPPGLGDGVQAVKAGIMEVPALFVVNKADLPGAKQAAEEIRQYLSLLPTPVGTWTPPVLLVASTRDEPNGVAEVWAAIAAHGDYMREGDRLLLARQARARLQLWAEAERQLTRRLREGSPSGRIEALILDIAQRRQRPDEAAASLIAGAFRPAP